MIGDKKTSRAVLEVAYVKAVAGILEQIFHMSSPHAIGEVAAWWSRMAGTSAMKSGVFLHDDPLQTASEIHGAPEPELSEPERLIYQKVLENSLDEAKAAGGLHKFWESEERRRILQSAKSSVSEDESPMKRLTAVAGR